ncbi:ribonuclease H-like domain-containing protein [Tanacetum coccineum]
MASLDHRLNPLFSIKECMSCGALYTRNCGCSKGSLEDKILVPIPDSSQQPPQNCATCGNTVDGLYCRPCAFVRKCLNEGWYTIHDENEIPNTSESSNDNTNVVNAPREPFVFNQDPGENSSQSPLQSNHNCCYKCGDSLDDIFCQRCTCKSCGNGAHIGYNCPPKAPIISNPEQCNQTINELPQTLPSVHPTCNSEDENSFTYDSKPNYVDDSPNVFNPPPQTSMYSCEFCGNNARYGHYCTHQVPFIYPEPCYNQDFNFPQDFHEFQQQYLCCENCGGPHETFQCQPMNEDYYEQNSCYDPNSFGFDQFQPLQYTVNHPILNAQNEFLNSQNKLMEQMSSICDMVGQIMQKKEEERRITENQAAKDRYWKIPICYDDDEDYTIAITPVLSTKEPVDSLIMEDEHLDTIPGIGRINMSVLRVLVQAQFSSELAHIDLIPPGINEDNLDPEGDIHLVERLLYDNSSPRPPEELNSTESFPPSHIPVEDSDSLMEEIDLFLASDESIPPGIDSDYSDSEGDNLFLERLLHDDPTPLLDIPSPTHDSSDHKTCLFSIPQSSGLRSFIYWNPNPSLSIELFGYTDSSFRWVIWFSSILFSVDKFQLFLVSVLEVDLGYGFDVYGAFSSHLAIVTFLVSFGYVTTKEKVQKNNDMKARSMLLMALPNEHLLTFNQYKDAKTLFAAIQTRFGGNEATKKTQKTLLKKMYENFSAPSTESLDSIFKRLQKIKSALNGYTHVVVEELNPDLDTISFDDLYNNFKIVKQEVKGTLVLLTLKLTLLALKLALLVLKFFKNNWSECITINGSDTDGYDKFKVECFNCYKMRHFARECRGPRNQDNRNMNQDNSRRTVNVEEISFEAMLAIDGAGFDWSYMAHDEVPTNMALMAFSDSEVHNDKTSKTCLKSFETLKTQLDDLRIEFNKSEFNLANYKRGLFLPPNLDLSNSGLEEFQQPEFEGYGPKTSKNVSEDTSNEVRESPDAPMVEELVSDDKLEKKTANCNYHQRERVVSGNNYTRVNYNYSAKKAHPSAHRNMAPRAVLMKTGLRPLNTARPVNTAHPKTTVYSARPMSHFSKLAQSTVKRPYQIKTALTNKNFSQKVNTAKGSFYTARPKAVNTARPNLVVVNAVRANQVNAVKASACWVWRPTKLNSASITLKRHNYGHPQKEDQGYVDSGCSRHMTGNMSYLSDFKKFDGGYVTFGGGAKGGKITCKGTLKTGKLDFEDVYFVKELQFNLFSVSQMCDKKNSVLFTDTRCFVLSPDFKLADESQVLLKVPRKNNMYSVDMKNIIPKESLTCLVAKHIDASQCYGIGG